ncbi:DDE-type integrase/transposase/recombinase [Aeromonas hydrophila]|uniref:Mu transposase C-terminal domain-containing protein n=1 Tax=Aeromonas hydrophila TaxID=644 RepID=UPI00227A4B36|nr:Mu transposase C-terminal domain-containing protein [Aeromonas hydrophila]WAF91657.1 DDE-type integrase/transposase/recombinase [Aeromonas hydrophila]WAG04383.1 DDE-type integrase/transposase/recombinase [Aeromonas hydrophila]
MSGTKLLDLRPGKAVAFKDHPCRIAEVLSLTEVQLVDETTREILTAPVSELAVPEKTGQTRPDISTVDEKSWALAKSRLAILKPLLNRPARTRAEVAAVAAQHSLHVNTLYVWLRAYEGCGLLSSLLPKGRSDKGQGRINEAVEELIREAIAAVYLTRQRKSQRKVCDEVRRRCLEAGEPPPHDNTVRNRIRALSGELVAARRLGRKTADLDFRPHEGKFPGADWPLSVVQIDHTKIDTILVDDHYRRPVGRPWITLAFDVFSRVVTGFYVSFDPPGAMSVGLCLVHAFLSKERWLSGHDVRSGWPVWGLPAKIHADNAKEFRGKMLQRACEEYGIDLEWRPVKRPQFGAHIERALGTFSKEIHELPGTTFSNTREKGDYDSEGKASLTLSEFETWLATYIVDVYHQKVHSSLDASPMAVYQRGIFGDDDNPGCGLPAKVADEERLRLDLMPFELRTVQDYGVVIDEIHYYHDVLRRWINAPDPAESRRKRKFMFRRDPRDISVIWFYDPELQSYYPIPYRDTSHPAISIWELREARKSAQAQGGGEINERAIFDAYERMREIEQKAVEKTKSARRAAQRRRLHGSAERPATGVQDVVVLTTDLGNEPEIQPFDEMDDMS